MLMHLATCHLQTPDFEVPPPREVLLLEFVPNVPLHAEQIAAFTVKDPFLSRVLHWILHDWIENWSTAALAVHSMQGELSVHTDCILSRSRSVS